MGFVLCVIAVCGWVSNALSSATCEERAAQWLYRATGRRDVLYVDSDGPTADAFSRLAIPCVPITGDPYDNDRYPYVKLRASCVVPFYVRVYYHWERAAEVGGTGELRHLCVFGKMWDFGEVGHFVF